MKKSERLYKNSKEIMPGGVSSPVRAFKAVGLTPIFIERGEGPYIYDVDEKRYIDFVLSWGPLILGHSHPEVVEEVKRACEKGFSYGMSTEKEVLLAEKIKKAFSFIDRIRFVNSGTEATMSALRVARAYTKRNKVVKFEGCYHGHSDSFLVKAGSGGLTFGIPSSPGIPKSVIENTIVLPYNNIEIVKDVFEKQGYDIACVIVEPIVGNMGVVLPKNGFLENLREITKRYDALLIFDEVITGFRVEFGGVGTQKGIVPDLITLGKVIGGGFPVGAYGGKQDIMKLVSPEGPVYQAGTLSGNPVAMTAGIKTLEILERQNPYPFIKQNLKFFTENLKEIFYKKGIPVSIPESTTFFSLFFSEKSPENLDEVQKTDKEMFVRVFKKALEQGIFMPPSPFEAMFLSIFHTKDLLGKVLEIFEKIILSG